ncbi:unnamed protein product, partial [Owenia fusiformis]
MSFKYTVFTLLLVMAIETSIARRPCIEHENQTCSRRNRNCPNTYKCVAQEEKCCQYVLPEHCDTIIQQETNAPWKCRGGGSIRCPYGYICITDPANRWNMCCNNTICHDDMGNQRRQYDGEWTQSDECTKCICLSTGETECDSSACTGSRCQRYGDYSPFSPCNNTRCDKQVKIRRCNSELRRRTSYDQPSLNDVELEMNTCYPQPSNQVKCPETGVALTESVPIVIGGQEVNPEHNYRWMVHLDLPGDCRCGGSILSPRHILTAAHCFDWVDGRNITIKTGKHKISDLGEPLEQTRKYQNFKIHKDYRFGSYDNDIAIINIHPPLEFNDHTQPINLPTKKFNDKTIKKLRKGLCQVIGWGDTAGKGGSCNEFKYSDVLMRVKVNLEENCNLPSLLKAIVTRNMFC